MKFYLAKRYFYKLLFSFLLIGVLPLIVVGPITYTLTKNILYRRAESLTETLSLNIDHILNKEMNQYISTIDTIIKDPSFDTLFNVSYQGDLASLYDSLYFLSSGYTIKPGIHIIDNNFNVIMNTITTPKEYYSEPFRSWGVLRKALVANGEPVLYYHQEKEDENRIMTIARVKIDENDEVLGMVLVDLYKEHISSFLPLEERFPQNSVLVLDEHNNRAFPIQGKIDDYALSAIIENLQSSKNIVRKGEHHPSFFYSLEYDEQFSFSVLTYYPLTQIDELLHLVAIIVISLAGLMTVMCIILALFVSRNAANPLQEVVDVLERVGKGDFTARTHIKRSDEFGKLGISVNEMVVKMKQLIDTNRQKEMSLRTSEIKSLMSQTKPHFIFNCLETIKWYILLGDTKEASQTIVDLGVLLRSNLDLGEGIVTVEEEVEIIQKYLALQKRRMGNRVHINIEIDPSILSVRIPRLLFQPIVENAVMHGLEKKRGKGELNIKGYKEQEYLHFIVEDDGMGMDQELGEYLVSYHKVNDSREGGSGVQNLVRRLSLYYGENAGIQIFTTLEKGTRVSIYISLKVGL